jgi:tRNA/rRNA methyltransferase
MDDSLLARCRVVLIRPQIAANIGATARVMRNMGLSELVLVAPVADPGDPEARRLATHGEAILEQARLVADMGTALADCLLVAGASARTGGPFRRQSVDLPEAIMPRLVQALASGPAALVFGPEPSGLTDEEVARCHFLIHIPTDRACPALNLAQAVAIALYELRRAAALPSPLLRGRASDHPADFEEQERMFERLREALAMIHFLYGTNAGSLMHALRHLIGRAGPTKMEVDLLFGLARQIRWYVEHGRSPPEGSEAP